MANQTDLATPAEPVLREGAVRQDIEKRVATLEKMVSQIINMLATINDRIGRPESADTQRSKGQHKLP